MNRVIFCAATLLALSACATTDGPRPAAPLAPLPESGTPQPYARLLERARIQASQATEAFYQNDWLKVQESADGLVATAGFIGKATDAPAKHADMLPMLGADLAKLANKLNEAARAKDVKATNAAMGAVNEKVRDMRLGDPTPTTPAPPPVKD